MKGVICVLNLLEVQLEDVQLEIHCHIDFLRFGISVLDFLRFGIRELNKESYSNTVEKNKR